MRNNEFYNGLVKECVELGDLDKAKERITDFTKDEIIDWMDNMPTYDLYDIIHEEVDEAVHMMDELDDVFNCESVTWILENLSDIDLYDDFFSEESYRSSDDIWELIGRDPSDIAESIYRHEIERSDCGLEEIFEREQYLVERITDEYQIYDKAKELFDQLMADDPHMVLTVLWNMKAEA